MTDVASTPERCFVRYWRVLQKESDMASRGRPMPGEPGDTPPNLLDEGGDLGRGSGDTRGPRKSPDSGDTQRSAPVRGSGDTR